MSESEQQQDFKNLCAEVVSHCGATAPVSWDDRFDAAVVQFKAREAAPVERALADAFARTAWTPETLPDAPGTVQEIADIVGGLDDTQQLFVSDTNRPTRLIVAWWPWRDGKTISLRFMLHSDATGESEQSPIPKTWFGL